MLVCCDVGMDSPTAMPVAHHNFQHLGDVESGAGSCQSNATPVGESRDICELGLTQSVQHSVSCLQVENVSRGFLDFLMAMALQT